MRGAFRSSPAAGDDSTPSRMILPTPAFGQPAPPLPPQAEGAPNGRFADSPPQSAGADVCEETHLKICEMTQKLIQDVPRMPREVTTRQGAPQGRVGEDAGSEHASWPNSGYAGGPDAGRYEEVQAALRDREQAAAANVRILAELAEQAEQQRRASEAIAKRERALFEKLSAIEARESQQAEELAALREALRYGEASAPLGGSVFSTQVRAARPTIHGRSIRGSVGAGRTTESPGEATALAMQQQGRKSGKMHEYKGSTFNIQSYDGIHDLAFTAGNISGQKYSDGDSVAAFSYTDTPRTLSARSVRSPERFSESPERFSPERFSPERFKDHLPASENEAAEASAPPARPPGARGGQYPEHHFAPPRISEAIGAVRVNPQGEPNWRTERAQSAPASRGAARPSAAPAYEHVADWTPNSISDSRAGTPSSTAGPGRIRAKSAAAASSATSRAGISPRQQSSVAVHQRAASERSRLTQQRLAQNSQQRQRAQQQRRAPRVKVQTASAYGVDNFDSLAPPRSRGHVDNQPEPELDSGAPAYFGWLNDVLRSWPGDVRGPGEGPRAGAAGARAASAKSRSAYAG